MRASVYTSANGGPFARVVDPTIDVAAWADALYHRSLFGAVVGALLEPNGIFLRGRAFGRAIPRAEHRRWQARGFEAVTDRSACLRRDPLKLAGALHGLTLWLYTAPAPLTVHVCMDLEQTNCRSFTLETSDGSDAAKYVRFPQSRSVSIQLLGPDAGGPACSEVEVEDVALLIKLGTN